jgi:protein arginine N-methyltransferase 1
MSSTLYSLDQFAAMFADPVRMAAYRGAIAKCVRPGDAVVDLGCGPGIFSLLACLAGAQRVYAIDLNGVVDFGRHLAIANGFGDRIHFLQGDSRQIRLPERVQVVISDVRGVLPLYSHAVGTLEDARNRFLAEGGQLLPRRDTLICAVMEAPENYQRIAEAWRAVPNLDLSSGLKLVLNGIYRQRFRPEQVISQTRAWHTLHYDSDAQTPATALFQLPIVRGGTGHGFGLWFETQLTDGIGYSTAPQVGDTVYGHIFLPWLEPIQLNEGEECSVHLQADLVGKDYIWQWKTTLAAGNGRSPVHFEQSNFYGSLFPPALLKKHAAEFVPELSETGLAERWIFQSMDGKRKLEDIASEAARLFPHVFRRVEDAFSRAADIAEKFTR